MHIDLVKTTIKVGDIILRNDESDNKIRVEWCENVPKYLLNDESGRVYLIVVNNLIMKIGGSIAKNGIKGTWSAYCNSLNGSPSVRSYGIHILIREELERGNRVELYLIISEKVQAPVKGLFGFVTKEIGYNFKEMENECKEDYFNIMGEYPPWNFQERNQAWPIYIQEGCNEINKKTTENSKKTQNENTDKICGRENESNQKDNTIYSGL